MDIQLPQIALKHRLYCADKNDAAAVQIIAGDSVAQPRDTSRILGVAQVPGLWISVETMPSWNLLLRDCANRQFGAHAAANRAQKSSSAGNSPTQPAPRAGLVGSSRRTQDPSILLAYGIANKEIANPLGTKPSTVRWHLENIYTNYVHSHSRTEALLKFRPQEISVSCR